MIKHPIISLAKNESGNILAISGLTIAIAGLFMLHFSSLIFVMKRKDELTNIANAACNEGLKPTRTLSDDDIERTAASKNLFDNLSSDRGFTVTKSEIKQDFLSGFVKASADIPSVSPLDRETIYPISVSVTCQGIPPYPKKNDVLLSSDFTWPGTTPLRQTSRTWAGFTAEQIGWDSHTGPGIEIQDWSKAKFKSIQRKPLPALSPEQTSSYVVELDSWGNSSMTKRVELHQGVYEFSLWYLARSNDNNADPAMNTNTIAVYIEGIRPQTPRERKIYITDTEPREWKRLSFQIEVDRYSLYDITVAGEGKSDTYGGLFNTLELKYIKRPKEKYPQDYEQG